MAQRDSFIFFRSIYEAVFSLPEEYQLNVLKLIFEYSLNGVMPDDNADSFAKALFVLVKPSIDKSIKRYDARVANGKKGGRPKEELNPGKPKETEENLEKPRENQDKDKDKDLDKDKAVDKDKDLDKDIYSYSASETEALPTPEEPEPIPEKQVKHKRGQYGWVKLSDEEFDRLVLDMGQEETMRCIKYVDESAQSNGNKNKWKDWNLVVRKCHREGWGLNRNNGGAGNNAKCSGNNAGAEPGKTRHLGTYI